MAAAMFGSTGGIGEENALAARSGAAVASVVGKKSQQLQQLQQQQCLLPVQALLGPVHQAVTLAGLEQFRPSDRKRPAVSVFDEFGAEGSGALGFEHHKSLPHSLRISPPSSCCSTAVGSPSMTGASSRSDSAAFFPWGDALASGASEASDSDMEDKENLPPVSGSGSSAASSAAAASPLLSLAVPRAAGSSNGQRLPLGDLGFSAFSLPVGSEDDADMFFTVETDSEDVEPHIWSENLAEALEDRVRSNYGGRYDFEIYQD